MQLLAIILIALFTIIGLWHLYWAAGGTIMKDAAIPTIDNKPTMEPPALITAIVGLAILSFGVLVAVAVGWLNIPFLSSQSLVKWLCYALATVFLLRAIGDFKYAGFSKKVKDSQFAKLDTVAYSPLCLFLSIGMFLIAPSA